MNREEVGETLWRGALAALIIAGPLTVFVVLVVLLDSLIHAAWLYTVAVVILAVAVLGVYALLLCRIKRGDIGE